MIKTICDLCRRSKAINDQFKTQNKVDVCEICQQKIERFTKESDELELEGE